MTLSSWCDAQIADGRSLRFCELQRLLPPEVKSEFLKLEAGKHTVKNSPRRAWLEIGP